MSPYAEIEAKFAAWADAQPDIRAAFVLGSRARTQQPADEWSDLDIGIITTDAERYIRDAGWVAGFGAVWLTFLERTPGGDFERRVLYQGALDVDFVPIPTGNIEAVLAGQVPSVALGIFRRGVRFIVDKDGLADRYAQIHIPPPEIKPPTEAEFLNLVADFWYHLVWAAKKLKRGETWSALAATGSHLWWGCWLPMVEWHARACGGKTETWFNGRFIEQWADEKALRALYDASARYDAADVARALHEAGAAFRGIALETAAALGFSYPHDADANISAWLNVG